MVLWLCNLSLASSSSCIFFLSTHTRTHTHRSLLNLRDLENTCFQIYNQHTDKNHVYSFFQTQTSSEFGQSHGKITLYNNFIISYLDGPALAAMQVLDSGYGEF